MNTAQQIVGLPVSFDSYIRHGWSLVPIPPNSKGPNTAEWNKKENCLTNSQSLPQGYGVGLAHAYSGTMAFDIDNWDIAKKQLADKGIDLQALFDAPDAVTINSGRTGHGKLLYAMPFGMVLPSKKLTMVDEDGQRVTYMEFRCATLEGLTVQDVMPPSIHPITMQPYSWGGKGHWERLPTVPFELINLWQTLIEQDQERSISAGATADASWNDIRAALAKIPPDVPRDDWIAVGMALHYAGISTNTEEQAYSLWDEWSAGGEKYKGHRDINACWRSFHPSPTGIKLGTLFKIAGDYGYTRPVPDARSLFRTIVAAQPNSVMEGLTVPPPSLNLDLFPPILAQRATEVGDSIGCDPAVPAMAGLAAVCAAADARIRLRLMEGWSVPPVLWLMTIGDPADKKTPAARPMLSILKQIEQEDAPRYAAELKKWEALDAAHIASKKAYIAAASDPANMLTGGLDMAMLPPVAEQPIKPITLRMTVDDVTSQKLIRLAADRPRGLLAHLDEMRGWADKLTTSGSGEDRSTWTKAYECDTQMLDRVGDSRGEVNIKAENFAVAIYGNMQPEVLKRYITPLSQDGNMQRFIPVTLRSQMSDRLNEPVSASLTNVPQYEEMIRRIYALSETTYNLSEGAFETFREFQRDYLQIKKDDKLLLSGSAYMTALGKLEGTCGRLMLIWHLMTEPYRSEVSEETAEKVIKLVKTFVVPSLRYVYGEVGGLSTDSLEYYLVEHIAHLSGDFQHVTLREIKRSARRRIEQMGIPESRIDHLIVESMGYLEAKGWVALVSQDRRSVQWAINPAVAEQHADYRKQVIEARQRRRDYIHEASGGVIPRLIVRGYEGE